MGVLAGEGSAAGEAGLVLDQAARDLLEPEVAALRAQVADPATARGLEALAAALGEGVVAGAAVDALEWVLRLGIETGRFERVHGRAADTLARELWARTPAGRAAAEQAAAVTAALSALRGAVLEAIRVAPDGPGGERWTLETDRGTVSLRSDRRGIRVESLEVGR